MKTSGRGTAGAFLVVGVVALHSAEGCQSSSQPQHPFPQLSAGSQAVEEQWTAISCGDKETYVPAAMNAKLKYYQDFASKAGVSTVSDCASARLFERAYATYLGAHPGFDLHQPLGLGPHGPPPALPSHIPPAQVQVQKILNGTSVQAAPVVQIQLFNAVGNETGLCSGTFIAKNWILTAAHCLPGVGPTFNDAGALALSPEFLSYFSDSGAPLLTAGGTNTVSGAPAFVMEGYAGAVIYWAAAPADEAIPGNSRIDTSAGVPPDNPNVADTLIALVYQYVDHRWTGWSEYFDEVAAGGQQLDGSTLPLASIDIDGFDVALIYVPPTYDADLPGSPDNGSAMAVSLVPSQDNGSFFGWGLGTSTNSTQLSQGVLPSPFTELGDFLSFTVPSGYSGPVVCHGDSGGPAVRVVNIPTDDAGAGGAGFAIVGVTHEVDSLNPSCGQNAGDRMNWVRTDVELDFINSTIQRWEPQFSCRTITDANTGQADFAECWGTPCNGPFDCNLPNTTCVGLQQFTLGYGQMCPGCAFTDPSGGCGCVKGECLPNVSPSTMGQSCVTDSECGSDAPTCVLPPDDGGAIGTCQVLDGGGDDGATE